MSVVHLFYTHHTCADDASARDCSPSNAKRKLLLDGDNVDDGSYYGWIIRAEAAAHARRLLTITRDTGYDSGQSDAHMSTGNSSLCLQKHRASRSQYGNR